jgi:predicted nucleic acid-binding protein
MPKAIYNKNIEEKEFYQTIFNQSEYITWDTEVLENSKPIAQTYGIAALDAIHIATALSVNVEKFYTAEKNTKPMFRVSEINVVSLLNS